MKKDANIFIAHMLESIDLIEDYTKDKTEDDFLNSIPLERDRRHAGYTNT